LPVCPPLLPCSSLSNYCPVAVLVDMIRLILRRIVETLQNLAILELEG
jgi:hypothetical protein